MGKRGSAVITLRQPTLAECQLVREWRNDPAVLPMLRTGYKTEDAQAAFYRTIIAPPWYIRALRWLRLMPTPHRYYAVLADGQFVGLGGLTHLQRGYREAEISLIIGPAFRGRRYGADAVGALWMEAKRLGLRAITGECYDANPAKQFWSRLVLLWPDRTEFHYDDMNSLHWRWELK